MSPVSSLGTKRFKKVDSIILRANCPCHHWIDELTQRLQKDKKFRFLNLSKRFMEKIKYTHKYKLFLKPGFKPFGPLGRWGPPIVGRKTSSVVGLELLSTLLWRASRENRPYGLCHCHNFISRRNYWYFYAQILDLSGILTSHRQVQNCVEYIPHPVNLVEICTLTQPIATWWQSISTSVQPFSVLGGVKANRNSDSLYFSLQYPHHNDDFMTGVKREGEWCANNL